MTTYPIYGAPNKPAPRVDLDVILRCSNYTGMHPTMKERLRALMEASGGRLGWGQGVRTPQQQLQMFLARHTLDPTGDVVWNGQHYRHTSGAAAVPPGRSMHEIGLAADMVGDFGWLHDNCARFGLQTFESVNNEPWHVQPVELPRGRAEYERNGAAWGALPDYEGGAAPRPDAATPAPPDPATLAAPSPTMAPALVANPGDSGPAARVLMEALVARGLLPDSPASRDGGYNADDRAIVEQFQRDNGLFVDGQVGPQTWSKLLATVEPGETGPMVKVLQTTLIVRSLIRDNPSNLDGVYGDATQQRVSDFQTVSGIDAIGTVGAQTWTALLGVKRQVEVSTRGGSQDEPIDLDDLDLVSLLDTMPAE